MIRAYLGAYFLPAVLLALSVAIGAVYFTGRSHGYDKGYEKGFEDGFKAGEKAERKEWVTQVQIEKAKREAEKELKQKRIDEGAEIRRRDLAIKEDQARKAIEQLEQILTSRKAATNACDIYNAPVDPGILRVLNEGR